MYLFFVTLLMQICFFSINSFKNLIRDLIAIKALQTNNWSFPKSSSILKEKIQMSIKNSRKKVLRVILFEKSIIPLSLVHLKKNKIGLTYQILEKIFNFLKKNFTRIYKNIYVGHRKIYNLKVFFLSNMIL